MTVLSMPLPNGWSTIALGELAVLINGDRGKNYPSKGDFTESGVPFINAGHLADGRINHARMNYISHSHISRLSSGKTLPGDVVYCLRGSLGKAALVTESDVGAIASSLVILRPNSFACSRFLYYFVVGPVGKSQIEEFDNGSAQPNLSAKSLGQYTVPLPPRNEQKRIADKLDQTLAIVERAKARLARVPEILKQFRQSVLAAATDGRLTEDWRDDQQREGDWDLTTIGDIAFVTKLAGFEYTKHVKYKDGGNLKVLNRVFIWTSPVCQDDLEWWLG